MASRDAYEFTARENDTIGKAATWAHALAGASFLMVAIHLAFAFIGTDFESSSLELLVFDWGAGVASATCYLAAAILFAVAGSALRRVVKTEGSDLTHLLKALDTLHRIFVVRIALVFLTVLAVVAVIFIGEGLKFG
jgi:hypothetical protein